MPVTLAPQLFPADYPRKWQVEYDGAIVASFACKLASKFWGNDEAIKLHWKYPNLFFRDSNGDLIPNAFKNEIALGDLEVRIRSLLCLPQLLQEAGVDGDTIAQGKAAYENWINGEKFLAPFSDEIADRIIRAINDPGYYPNSEARRRLEESIRSDYPRYKPRNQPYKTILAYLVGSIDR